MSNNIFHASALYPPGSFEPLTRVEGPHVKGYIHADETNGHCFIGEKQIGTVHVFPDVLVLRLFIADMRDQITFEAADSRLKTAKECLPGNTFAESLERVQSALGSYTEHFVLAPGVKPIQKEHVQLKAKEELLVTTKPPEVPKSQNMKVPELKRIPRLEPINRQNRLLHLGRPYLYQFDLMHGAVDSEPIL